jgi:D-sedoheptulose 7-phosphate isomerase
MIEKASLPCEADESGVLAEFRESCSVKEASAQQLKTQIVVAANLIAESVRLGGKVIFFGNGGSAADAQHLAAELVGRYAFDRPPVPAIVLHGNTSAVTAISNDYGYEEVFARQVRAFASQGDVVIGISTSGASPNVLKALQSAQEAGSLTIGLTGDAGRGLMARFCDVLLAVPSRSTPRIQEAHITIGHVICGLVEKRLFAADKA